MYTVYMHVQFYNGCIMYNTTQLVELGAIYKIHIIILILMQSQG